MAGVDQQGPSWDEAKTQWERINARVSRDIPSLRTIPWEAILQSGGVPQFGESRSAQLLRYLLALDDVCQQALYAMERLPLFTCRGEYSSPWELYAKYYIYDVLSRVKTATDLLALLLNVVFGLGLPTKECSLERGYVAGALTSFSGDDRSIRLAARSIGAALNGAQNDWVASFYDLRNLVIHRNGLKLAGVWNRQIGDSHIYVHVSSLLQAAGDRKVVERIVTQLGLLEGELSSSSVVEPVNMCEKLWARLADLVDSVLHQSGQQIDHFVSEQGAAREGNTRAEDDGETGG